MKKRSLLAFFPAHKMQNHNSPSLSDMIRVYQRVKELGLKKVKLGNCGVFAKYHQDWEYLLREVGKYRIG